jgi:PKD repeat protein
MALVLQGLSQIANAQSFVASIEPHTSGVLSSHFTQYQVFRLDAKMVDKYVKSNAESPMQLIIGAHNWNLSLTPNRILADNYSVQYHTAQGTTTTYEKPNIAFEGYELNGGGQVRLTMRGEFLYGYIFEGQERYYIEPLWYFEPMANRDLFVLYPQSAVNPMSPDACGVTEEQIKMQHLEDAINDKVEQNNADNLACYELEIAIASDELMLDKYGSVGGVEDHNIGVLNNVEGDYTGQFNHDLVFVIVTQFVSDDDPWTASTDAGTLLGSFRDWGNNGGFGVAFDVGELWTDRDFNGGTIGIAYLSGICNSVKYHCLQDFTGNSAFLRVLTSHELGHNFSSGHDGNCPPDEFIMCPFVSDATEWSNQSRNAINNYMQGRINNGCLAPCGPALIADFTWSPDPGCEDSAIEFTDLTSGNVTNWAWVFPGGIPSVSNQQNPTVTWNTPGTRDITLTATGPNGSSSITKSITIDPAPVANFTFTVNGLVVTFTNTSQHGTSYEWDFGDGGFSTEENPVHEYPYSDIFTVTLTVTNECGTAVKTMTVNTAPTANFEASPTSGCASLVVVMDNQSSSNALTFQWSFPGGAPATSNQPNPTVVYNLAGTYTITLRASNQSGSDTMTRVDYITVGATPVANFTYVLNGATATFTNSTIGGATSFHWSFGDGDTSNVTNPVHTYNAPGTYTVVLTATNDCGSTTKTTEIVVVSQGLPTAAFTANPSVGCEPLTVNFTNNSTGAVSYSWEFPGGTPSTSTETNPTVVYDSAGVYTVILTATNADGSNSDTATITVNSIPTAGFTYVFNNDSTVTFTNTTLEASSFLWTFGDGDSSTLANPIHEYPSLDTNITYQVILFATNDCGTVSDTQLITIVTLPVAGFSATPDTGCAPLTVQFNNSSTPNATSFIWDFPGGNPDSSGLANPVVVYNTPGTYSVTLIAINSAGRDTIEKVNFIVVNTVPSAGFTSAANGLTVTFSNTSTGATSYAWEFGDGGTSTEANPVHTYAADGTYTVILSATNDCGTVTSTQTVTVATAPTAGFTASANNGCAPLTVQFTNTSSPNATSYDWQFPSGTPSTSTAQNPPSVEYAVPGTYIVTLTVSNAAGSSTATQTIVVNGGPNANFSSSVSGLTATFTNLSIGATAYSWTFGDGAESNEANPVHTYAADGNYTVVLTVSNDCGTSTFTQNVLINTEPGAGFSVSTTSGCAVLSVEFTDISSGDPVSWEWTFEGGTPSSSTEQNPTVQYFTPGVYDVTLVVTSAGGGTSSFTQSNIITVNGAPSAGFTFSNNGANVSFTNTSVGATSYAWNFGDSSNSTDEDPVHTYQNNGTYTVTLAATNNCGTTIFEQTVTVVTPPTAGFNFSGSSGCTPYTVQFFNASSANTTSLLWDFPGGEPSSSTEENPVVTWNNAGVYEVTLTAFNAAGSNTSVATITVAAAPVAGFDYQANGLAVTFTNTSTNGVSYSWNFGDGSDASTEANPVHTYSSNGTYVVTLSVTNECGTVTVSQTITIEGSAPVPAIGADQQSGCIPLTVQFTDQSGGNPNSWNWTFSGGTPTSSTAQNPQVVYTTPGVYDVTLEVSNGFGSNTLTFPAYVTVQGAPSAGFTYSAVQNTVTFTNSSQDATSFSWNFGDNQSSTEQNPVHTYTASGTYTVSLAATNNCGTTIFEQTITLSSSVGEAAWVESFRLFPNPNTGAFVVEMNGLPQDEVEFVLFNAVGQMIKREIADFGTGNLMRNFDYGVLPSGMYTLRVQANGQAMYIKVIVGK